MARPPSSQPAACSTKLTPPRIVGCSVAADSYAACASGSLEAQSEPPDRNGTPSLRARAATVYSTIAGSGVPNVGAPVCIDIELANEPNTTGAPGRTSCVNAMPAKDSASVWAATPADVAGAIAPARMNGVMMVAWLLPAYTSAAASMLASHTSGEEALMRLVITVRSWRSPPKAIRASSTESAARSPAVTEPMKPLSLYLMCEYTMSRWRLLTGTSTGSHTV